MKQPRIIGSITATIAVLAFLEVIVGVPLHDGWGRAYIRTTSIFIMLIAGAAYTYAWHIRPLKKSHLKTKILQLSQERTYELQRLAGRKRIASADQVKMFTLAVIAPSELRMRVVERFEPRQRTLRSEVTVEGILPSRVLGKRVGGFVDGTDRILFPAIIPRKGHLLDRFELRDGDGNNVPGLAYREYLELVAQTLRDLLSLAYNAKDTDLPAFVEKAEYLALRDVMYRGIDEQLKVKEGTKALGELQGAVNPGYLQLATRLVEKLTEHYCIVAAVTCESDGRFVLKYEQSEIPILVLRSKDDVWASIKGLGRILLGARPVDLSIPLENAWTTQSYHLRFDTEDTLYLGSQDAPELEDYITRHGPTKGTPPYYRFQRRMGQSYAHFYCRFFPEPIGPTGPPTIRFRFFEKPPGSVFRAAVAAATCFALVYLVAIGTSITGDPKTDAPTILLVLPAAAAAWLGFDSPTRRLLEGTLAARLSLFVTAMTSVAASALYVVYWSSRTDMRQVNPFGLSVLGVHLMPWSILIMVSLVNAVSVGYTYLVRSWHFTHLATAKGRTDAGAKSKRFS